MDYYGVFKDGINFSEQWYGLRRDKNSVPLDDWKAKSWMWLRLHGLKVPDGYEVVGFGDNHMDLSNLCTMVSDGSTISFAHSSGYEAPVLRKVDNKPQSLAEKYPSGTLVYVPNNSEYFIGVSSGITTSNGALLKVAVGLNFDNKTEYWYIPHDEIKLVNQDDIDGE